MLTESEILNFTEEDRASKKSSLPESVTDLKSLNNMI